MKKIDIIFMKRAIKLAKNGLFIISNTPIFGYVIVRNNLILLEDWKKMNEYNYIKNNIIKNIFLLQESTIYLTSEPEVHKNKLSFIDFILKYKIPKVVIGIRNIFNEYNGVGIKILKSSGVKVIENILKNECYEINKKYFTFYKKKRPFIILKWRQSINGILCNKIENKNILNNELYKQLTDKWRTEEDAILLDNNNILYNNSILKDKYWYGKNPIIVILDKKLIIPNNHFIYNSTNTIIIFTEKNKKSIKNNIIFFKLKFDKNLSKKIVDELYKKNIKSIIIEESKKNIEIFIKNNFWDEAKISIYDIYLNKGIKAPNIIGNILSNQELFFNERILIISYKN